jgi:GH15 family glucan-1,4-alpha-glucosidase
MYPPIEDHGIIGNLRTAALVSVDGTIDFFCPLRFDGPTLFASLLDADRGGYCTLSPEVRSYKHKQLYWPDTNILMTRYLAPEGVVEIIDFMPLGGDMAQSTIIRRVTVTRGEVAIRFGCKPAFNYASDSIRSIDVNKGKGGAVFRSKGSGVLFVESDMRLSAERGSVVSRFRLKRGQRATFDLTYMRDDSTPLWRPAQADEALEETARFWQNWAAICTYKGRWRETVVRSALLLKLLTYEPTGAIVAAPTFGLPEDIGGLRNWDYRYTWLRDAAFTLQALLRLGYHNEALHFMSWIRKVRLNRDSPEGQDRERPLQIMYRVDGETDLEERDLGSLKGYRGSSPVRVGNAASSQLQLDAIGGAFSVALFEVNAGIMLEYDRWNKMREVLTRVAKVWDQPDQSIWETRGEPLHFLHSKLMCWVALDRAIKIAQAQSLPAPTDEWVQKRNEVYNSIHSGFWNEELKSFTQYRGSSDLDASVLLMIPVGFISPSDPRWLSTLKAVTDRLSQDIGVLRYDTKTGVDGLLGSEGAFTPCSFWYIDALARSGELDRARIIFEKILGYSNHLGLYAEELGLSGEHLGNFPQALTHLSLILSALQLNDALEKERSPARSA